MGFYSDLMAFYGDLMVQWFFNEMYPLVISQNELDRIGTSPFSMNKSSIDEAFSMGKRCDLPETFRFFTMGGPGSASGKEGQEQKMIALWIGKSFSGKPQEYPLQKTNCHMTS